MLARLAGKCAAASGIVVVAMGAGCSMSNSLTSVDAPESWGSTQALISLQYEVRVSPEIGRVTHFSRKGEPNVLWTDAKPPYDTFKTFINYGGDKLWSWPQDGWEWPPPPELDVGPYRFNPRGSPGRIGFQMLGESIAKSGLKGMRTSELRSSGLLNIYGVEATRDVPRAAAWSIVQVPPPDAIYVRLLPGTSDPVAKNMNGILVETKRLDERWVEIIPRYNSGKVGFPGDLLAAKWGDRVLVIKRTKENDNPALDRPVSAQIYLNALPKGTSVPDETTYVEMEFIGPTHALKSGEQASLETEWSILTASEFRGLMMNP